MTARKANPSSSQKTSGGGRPTVEEFEAVAPHIPAVADRIRLVALDRTSALGAVRERALAREEARRSARFGENSPAAAAVAARLDVERLRQGRRREAVRLAETGLELKPDEAVVLGRITDQAGQPVAGVTVRLTDERGPEKGYLAQATTDEAGFYVLKAGTSDFRKFFEKSKNLTLAVTGGGLAAPHLEVRSLTAPEARVRKLDLQLPKRVVPAKPDRPVAPKTPVNRVGPRPGPAIKVNRAPRTGGSGGAAAIPTKEVSGIGQVRSQRLASQGVTTAAKVADMKAPELAKVLDVSEGQAAKIIQDAKRTVEKQG